jgi:hypothetical protein
MKLFVLKLYRFLKETQYYLRKLYERNREVVDKYYSGILSFSILLFFILTLSSIIGTFGKREALYKHHDDQHRQVYNDPPFVEAMHRKGAWSKRRTDGTKVK